MGVKKFWSDLTRKLNPSSADKLLMGDSATGEAQYCNIEDLPLTKAMSDAINKAIVDLKNAGVITASYAGEMRPYFGSLAKIPTDWALVGTDRTYYSKADYPDYYQFLGGEDNPFGVTSTQFCGIYVPEGYVLSQSGNTFRFVQKNGSNSVMVKNENLPEHDHFTMNDDGDGEPDITGSNTAIRSGSWGGNSTYRMKGSGKVANVGKTNKAGSASPKALDITAQNLPIRWIVKLKNTGGIPSASINANGDLLFSYPDGTTQNCGSFVDPYTVRSVIQNFSQDQKAQVRVNIEAASVQQMLDEIAARTTAVADEAAARQAADNNLSQAVSDLTAALGVIQAWKSAMTDADADNVVNTLTELLNLAKNIPEGADLAALLAQKVNASDIVDNLTSVLTNAPLSAYQGNVLKSLIDTLQGNISNHIQNADVHVSSEDRQSWNGKYSKPNGGIPGSDLSDDAVMYSKQGADFKNIASLSGSGTITIDMSAYAVFFINMTGAVTLEIINPQVNKVVTLLVSGNFTLNFPNTCVKLAGTYDGTVVNYVQLHCVYAPAASYYYTIAKPA